MFPRESTCAQIYLQVEHLVVLKHLNTTLTRFFLQVKMKMSHFSWSNDTDLNENRLRP